MHKLTANEVNAFCHHCDWCFQCWQTVKSLYSENPERKYFHHPAHIHFFDRLWKILQEYWLHEVAKLGDPAAQGGHANLSIHYVYNHGDWPQDVARELDQLRSHLLSFTDKTRAARNKLLAHKDVETITSGITLGEFDEGDDDKYFERLRRYASLAHQQYFGEPYLFDDLTKNDVDVFTSTFVRGILYEGDC